jgi:hypothetical protein
MVPADDKRLDLQTTSGGNAANGLKEKMAGEDAEATNKAVFSVRRGGEWVRWETYGNALDQPCPTVGA